MMGPLLCPRASSLRLSAASSKFYLNVIVNRKSVLLVNLDPFSDYIGIVAYGYMMHFSLLHFAAPSVIQCVQEYGNCHVLPEYSR